MVFGINRSSSEAELSKGQKGDSWNLDNLTVNYYVQYVANAANDALSSIISVGPWAEQDNCNDRSKSFKSSAIKYTPGKFRTEVMKKKSFSSGCMLPKDYVCYSKFATHNGSMEVKRNVQSEFYLDHTEVLVQIEASTVTTMDSELYSAGILKGDLGFMDKHPIIPGSAFVGCIQAKGGSVVTTRIKDRVVSFCPKGGANSSFITVDESQLVQVPEKMSSLAAVIVTGVYLPVFQALQIGFSKENRYNLKSHSLKGKTVLLHAELASSFIEPVVRLAKSLGAKDIYVSLPESSTGNNVEHLKYFGAKLFDESFKGHVDILINDTDDATTNIDVENVLVNDGFKVTIQKHKPYDAALKSTVTAIANLLSQNPHFIYNPACYWENELDLSKKDLIFLLHLVSKKAVVPRLGRTLRLEDVPLAHLYIEMKKPLRGSFVCLPWHE